MPPFFLLVFGIIEISPAMIDDLALALSAFVAGAFAFGMAWRKGLAVDEGVRAGARVGSSQGNGKT